MGKSSSMLVGAILIVLIGQAVAQLPSDAVGMNRKDVVPIFNRSIIDPMDPGYVWGNPFAVDLSGVNPVIFDSHAFHMDTGGLAAGSLYTTSMNDFRNADKDGGASNATRKAAKVGIVSLI